MPMPVSLTEKDSCTSSPSPGTVRNSMKIEPCSVNFIALPTRLMKICRTAPGRP